MGVSLPAGSVGHHRFVEGSLASLELARRRHFDRPEAKAKERVRGFGTDGRRNRQARIYLGGSSIRLSDIV
jgi:hypothetical protein